MIKLKDGEYYWLDAPAIDDLEPLMIGQYHISGTAKIWYIGRQRYTAGVGIDVIKHIPKPRNM